MRKNRKAYYYVYYTFASVAIIFGIYLLLRPKPPEGLKDLKTSLEKDGWNLFSYDTPKNIEVGAILEEGLARYGHISDYFKEEAKKIVKRPELKKAYRADENTNLNVLGINIEARGKRIAKSVVCIKFSEIEWIDKPPLHDAYQKIRLPTRDRLKELENCEIVSEILYVNMRVQCFDEKNVGFDVKDLTFGLNYKKHDEKTLEAKNHPIAYKSWKAKDIFKSKGFLVLIPEEVKLTEKSHAQLEVWNEGTEACEFKVKTSHPGAFLFGNIYVGGTKIGLQPIDAMIIHVNDVPRHSDCSATFRVTETDQEVTLKISVPNSGEVIDKKFASLAKKYLDAYNDPSLLNELLTPAEINMIREDKSLKQELFAAFGYLPSEIALIKPMVVATIQIGPEWEPLGRGEPLTVTEVHSRVKHVEYKSELVRYGEFIFNDASWGLQGAYACVSCHQERGQTTSLIWDLGDEGWGSWKNVKNIRGARYVPPFRHEGFTGHPDEIVGAASSLDRVCGRYPGFVFRSENFSSERLEALIAYVRSLEFAGSPFRNPDGTLTAAQKRGEKIFNDPRVGCSECHPGDASDLRALFSDGQTHDVGTGRIGVKGFRSTPGKVFNIKALEAGEDPYGEESGTPIIGLDMVKEFDTPTLRDIYASGTYFHDGSVRTLMDTINNTVTDKDMHGRTSHLSAQDLQDLVEFMKAL